MVGPFVQSGVRDPITQLSLYVLELAGLQFRCITRKFVRDVGAVKAPELHELEINQPRATRKTNVNQNKFTTYCCRTEFRENVARMPLQWGRLVCVVIVVIRSARAIESVVVWIELICSVISVGFVGHLRM